MSVAEKTIGSRIAQLRRNAGYSQERFAELIGRNRNAVRIIEHDESAPKADTLMAICQVLNVSADTILFGGAEDEVSKDDETAKMIERIHRLDPRHRKAFFSLAAGLLTSLECLQLGEK